MNIPDDLYTHENSWRKALERLIELEPVTGEPDEDNRGFWEHELRAFNHAYEQLHKGCPHDGATYYDMSGRERCGMCGGDI